MDLQLQVRQVLEGAHKPVHFAAIIF